MVINVAASVTFDQVGFVVVIIGGDVVAVIAVVASVASAVDVVATAIAIKIVVVYVEFD